MNPTGGIGNYIQVSATLPSALRPPPAGGYVDEAQETPAAVVAVSGYHVPNHAPSATATPLGYTSQLTAAATGTVIPRSNDTPSGYTSQLTTATTGTVIPGSNATPSGYTSQLTTAATGSSTRRPGDTAAATGYTSQLTTAATGNDTRQLGSTGDYVADDADLPLAPGMSSGYVVDGPDAPRGDIVQLTCDPSGSATQC